MRRAIAWWRATRSRPPAGGTDLVRVSATHYRPPEPPAPVTYPRRIDPRPAEPMIMRFRQDIAPEIERELDAFADRGEPGAPDSRVLQAIAAALGVDVGDLIRWIPTAGKPSVLEQQLRDTLATEVHKIRFDGGVGSVPDSFFWGVTYAERIIRGEVR